MDSNTNNTSSNTGNSVIGTCEKRKALLFNTYDNSKDYIDLPTITTTLYHNKLLYHYYGVSDGVACYSTIKQSEFIQSMITEEDYKVQCQCAPVIKEPENEVINKEEWERYSKETAAKDLRLDSFKNLRLDW